MSPPGLEKIDILHMDKEHDRLEPNATTATRADDHISPDAIGK
jgi:hypothetical protein